MRIVSSVVAVAVLVSMLGIAGCSSGADDSSAPVSSSSAPVFESGKWQVNAQGLPFVTPENEFGDIITTEAITHSEMSNCIHNEKGGYRISRVMPQIVQGRYVLFSEEDGPFKHNDDNVPVGYAHTPHGAALSAYNMISLAMPGGEYGASTEQAFFDLADNSIPSADETGMRFDFLPSAFRFTGCSEHTALVELLVKRPNNEYTILSLPLAYDDGNWVMRAQHAPDENSVRVGAMSEIEIREWQQWEFG